MLPGDGICPGSITFTKRGSERLRYSDTAPYLWFYQLAVPDDDGDYGAVRNQTSGLFYADQRPCVPGPAGRKNATQRVPPAEFSLLRAPAVEIIRELSRLNHPVLKPLVIAHAPAAAEAWLSLRMIQVTTLSEAQSFELNAAVHLSTDSASDIIKPGTASHLYSQLIQIPARDCFTETQQLNRHGWKTEAILQLLLVAAGLGWDQALIPLG